MLRCRATSVVIAVVITFVRGDGYGYPQPQPLPPIQFDEPSSPPPPLYIPPPPFQEDDIPQIAVPTYLPPNIYPPIGSPPINDEIQPPFDDTVVIPSPPTNQYLPPSANSRSQLGVLSMSCLDSRDGSGYFRTSFRPTSTSRSFPVIESSPSDCAITTTSSDTFRIDLEGQRMIDCGVRTCGNRMCLTVRMAAIGGLRLADDPLVTLQCIPQEAVVSHTKHLRLNTNAVQGRSSARSVAVASGGNQRRFDTQINLFRRSSSSGSFDQPIQQGSSVRLGDELMLRAAVRDGDGWRQSRLGSVVIRSAASQRSVTMVDEDGCRSPAMRSIVPQQPQQVSPLVVQLPFRAFLFQGAAPADDLLLAVRMLGCLRARDCYQSKSCEDARNRIRRTTGNETGNETISDWESEFQFRVLPNDVPLAASPEKNTNFLVLACLGVTAGALICVAFLMIKPLKQHELRGI